MQVQTDKNGMVYVHSASISRSVFEQFYLEIGKVFSQCFDSVNQAHLALSAPQLAYPALKSIATKAGNWDGAGGVKFGLVNEIVRLTNVLIIGEGGWESNIVFVKNIMRLKKLFSQYQIKNGWLIFICLRKSVFMHTV